MQNNFSLNGFWKLKTDSINFSAIDANLPGDNYSALLNAGIIPDPYYSTNEKSVQEYRKYTWEYSRSFQVNNELLAFRNVYLETSMVDTFCTCLINGRKAFESSNMFDVVRVDVKKLLRKGDNSITFIFAPVEPEIEKRAKKCSMYYSGSSNSVLSQENLLRKVACHGGWDWGITLVVSGIYDNISLHGVNKARLDYLYASQQHKNGTVQVTATAELFAERSGSENVTFTFNGETAVKKVNLQKGCNKVNHTFTVTGPKLWWPAGYGEQPLYELTASTDSGEEKCCSIGLRKIEVVNEKDSYGKSMFFRVNGIDVFCKGADWIPCDAMPERQTRDVYENLLESARLANMNMVRLWGGGQYERDCFYDICDRKGILVWHDFMFSCACYPADEWYLKEVRAELSYQIRRLRHHSSIAMWCGDNECLGAVRWHNALENHTKYYISFSIFNRELAKLVEEHDPERAFWPTSPCGGPGQLGDCFKNDSEGDMHYWGVWHGGKDMTAYYSVKPRFCSEFGFEAFPSVEQIRSFCPEDEMNLFSPVIDHRQKCIKGNTPILNMLGNYFRMPKDFESMIYVSQVQQAIAIKTGAEFWRSLKPRCMGTIFWQLNDDWPTVSWSAIEYGGKWKQLMYHAKRFYAPVISTVFTEDNKKTVLCTSSDLKSDADVTVNVQAFDCDGTLHDSKVYKMKLDAGAAATHKDFALLPEDSPLFYEITTEYVSNGKKCVHRNTYFPVKFKSMPMRESNVSVKVTAQSEKCFEIELTTDYPAFFVTLDATGIPGVFSDNSITLLPGEKRKLLFMSGRDTDADSVAAAIELKHLRNSY